MSDISDLYGLTRAELEAAKAAEAAREASEIAKTGREHSPEEVEATRTAGFFRFIRWAVIVLFALGACVRLANGYLDDTAIWAGISVALWAVTTKEAGEVFWVPVLTFLFKDFLGPLFVGAGWLLLAVAGLAFVFLVPYHVVAAICAIALVLIVASRAW